MLKSKKTPTYLPAFLVTKHLQFKTTLPFNQMEAYDITCPFKWSKGDVLIWDNRFTLHYPINDFSGVRRKMILTSVMEAI